MKERKKGDIENTRGRPHQARGAPTEASAAEEWSSFSSPSAASFLLPAPSSSAASANLLAASPFGFEGVAFAYEEGVSFKD